MNYNGNLEVAQTISQILQISNTTHNAHHRRTLNNTNNIMPHITHHPKMSLHKVTMLPKFQALCKDHYPSYHPPKQHPILLSTLSPQPNNNTTNNEGGGNAPKWALEEDRRLVKLWINVSTYLMIGAGKKKSDF